MHSTSATMFGRCIEKGFLFRLFFRSNDKSMFIKRISLPIRFLFNAHLTAMGCVLVASLLSALHAQDSTLSTEQESLHGTTKLELRGV